MPASLLPAKDLPWKILITILPRDASLGCPAGRLAERLVNPLKKCFSMHIY